MNRPALTVCIECENLVYHSSSRFRRSLVELARQVRDSSAPGASSGIAAPTRVLIGIGSPQVDRDLVQKFITEADPEGRISWEVHLLPGRRYYELKNDLVKKASGDLVVMLDSDVIPQPGWLENLISPFQNEETQIVGGATFTTSQSLLTRGASLWWFFPPLGRYSSGVARIRYFFANNLALRRQFAVSHPFPEIEHLNRGSCAMLAATLMRSGVPILQAHDARVEHSFYEGFGRFIQFGLLEGNDQVVRARFEGRRVKPWSPFFRLARGFLMIAERTARRYPRSSYSVLAIPAAFLTGAAFMMLAFVGEWVAILRPDYLLRSSSASSSAS